MNGRSQMQGGKNWILPKEMHGTECREPVMGKHPDLMVGPPTSTVFPTNDRNFERSQFFEKIFEKI
jgi:hypothetical protein